MKKQIFSPVIDNCYICGKEFIKKKHNQTRCEECKKLDLRKCLKHNKILEPNKKCVECCIEESHVKYTKDNRYYWVECVCGYRAADLSTHIICQHKDENYQDFVKNNNLKIKSDYLCDKVKGENNPGYQHGCKFSSLSDNFIYADKIDKNEIIKKISKSNRENGNNNATIKYWLDKCNGDMELAIQKLSERQKTFSLEKCIEKYGEEKGTEIWQTRQDTWIKTLNNKSEDEIQDINRRKSNLINFNSVWKNELQMDCIFYILDINFNKLKIGITTKKLHKRYRNTKTYKIIKTYNSTQSHCFQIEQLLKKFCKKYSITKNEEVGQFGWTETFYMDSKDFILEFCNEYFNDINKTIILFKENFNLKYADNFIVLG